MVKVALKPKGEFEDENSSYLLGKLNNPYDRLVIISGPPNSGKTKSIKNYLSKKSNRNILVLGADSQSAIELGVDDVFSFFNFPLERHVKDFFRLIDYHLLPEVDEIIIDGFDFERKDIFLSIIKSIHFSLQKNPEQSAFDDIKLIVSGRMSSALDDPFYKEVTKDIVVPEPKIIEVNTHKGLVPIDRVKPMSMETKLIKLFNANVVNNPCLYDFLVISNSFKTVLTLNKNVLLNYRGSLMISKGKEKDKFSFHKPVDETFYYKEGMKVIFADYKRDRKGNLLYSKGDFGVIIRRRKNPFINVISNLLNLNKGSLDVLLDNGNLVKVKQHTWKSMSYSKEDRSRYKLVKDGTFTQYPLISGFAVRPEQGRGLIPKNVFLDFNDFNELKSFIKEWQWPVSVCVSPQTIDLLEKHLEVNRGISVDIEKNILDKEEFNLVSSW